MKNKTRMIAAGAVALGMAASGASAVFATSTQPTEPMQGLASAIAAKFNLKAADVEQVIKDQFEAHRAEMEAAMKDRLAKKVTDGKLTQAQADEILAHRSEVKAFGPRAPGHMMHHDLKP